MVEKRCKILMLPTEDETNIVLSNGKPTLAFKGVHKLVNPEILIYQHLYIISDDNIEEGDWYSEAIMGSYMIHQMTEKSLIGWYKTKDRLDNFRRRCRKIIATTDINLNREKIYRARKKGETLHQDVRGTYEWIKSLNAIPIIKEPFISEYCYKNGFDEVLVRYEFDGSFHTNQGEYKLDIDSIKFAKDSWTKEEVEELCRKALHSKRPNNNICMQEDADKWVKENL